MTNKADNLRAEANQFAEKWRTLSRDRNPNDIEETNLYAAWHQNVKDTHELWKKPYVNDAIELLDKGSECLILPEVDARVKRDIRRAGLNIMMGLLDREASISSPRQQRLLYDLLIGHRLIVEPPKGRAKDPDPDKAEPK